MPEERYPLIQHVLDPFGIELELIDELRQLVDENHRTLREARFEHHHVAGEATGEMSCLPFDIAIMLVKQIREADADGNIAVECGLLREIDLIEIDLLESRLEANPKAIAPPFAVDAPIRLLRVLDRVQGFAGAKATGKEQCRIMGYGSRIQKLLVGPKQKQRDQCAEE